MLDKVKVVKEMDRDSLINVASTSLRTKINSDVADILTEVSCVVIHCPRIAYMRDTVVVVFVS